MSDTRTPYISYFEDLARRHAQIAHDPATESAHRFFLELDYGKLLGGSPNNTSWNMVLMGYETDGIDNKHGERYERVTCVFDILKHVPDHDIENLQLTYAQARVIGREILDQCQYHIDHCEDRVLSEGIEPPYSIDWNSLRTIEVGPRYEDLFGYRFIVNILQETERIRVPQEDRWRSLPDDPPIF
jgi:hypothetical protein